MKNTLDKENKITNTEVLAQDDLRDLTGIPKINSFEFAAFRDDDCDKIVNACQALGNKERFCILKRLLLTPMTLVEIVNEFGLSNSSVMYHLKLLIDAGFVKASYLPSKKGKTQLFYSSLYVLNIDFFKKVFTPAFSTIRKSVPVGAYTDAYFDANFRIRDKDTNMCLRFNKNDVFNNQRFNANSLWTECGFVEYSFSNDFIDENNISKLKRIDFSVEVCSEVFLYRNDYKSEIFFYINGIELCSFISSGDYGERRGKYTEEIIPPTNSQYGNYVNVAVTNEGVLLNEKLVNTAVTLSDLHLIKDNKIKFKLGNKKDSPQNGGFNIFGKGIGEHNIDIELAAVFEE